MWKFPEKKTGIMDTPMQLAIALLLGMLLGVATWASPPGVMIGLGVVIATIIILQRPVIAVLGVIILLSTLVPETRIPVINVGAGRLYVSEPFIIGMLAVVIIRWLINPKVKLLGTPVDLLLISFLVWAVLSTTIAIAQSRVTITDAIPEVRNLSYYVLFFLVTNLVTDKKNIKFFINGFFLLATITAGAMIVQYALGYSLPFLEGRVEALDPSRGITRITDTPGEALITIAVILKSMTLLTSRIRAGRMIDFIQWGLFVAALMMTYNRTHWVMVAIAILFTFYLMRGEKKEKFIYWSIILFILVLTAVLLAAATPDFGISRFINASVQRSLTITAPDSYTDVQESTLQWRSFEYRYGFPQIFSHPIFGLGLGARYRPTLQDIDHPGFAGEYYTHNGLLWIAMKTGLIGFTLMILMFIILIVRGFKYWRMMKDPLFQSIYLGTTLMLLGLVIGSNIHPLVITTFWTPLLGVFMGLNESILRLYIQPSNSLKNDL